MNYTHEVWYRGKLFWYFDTHTGILYNINGKFQSLVFNEVTLEALGYNLEEVSFSIENE